jgi:4-cresol dehydrogenase (hydroxylating)
MGARDGVELTRGDAVDADLLGRLRAALGAEQVRSEPAEVEARAATTVPRAQRPLAYAYPGSTGEVQAVLEICRDLDVPVWPCSQGRNFGYGAATPDAAGAVVMVLSRMDRILEVNEELAYAVIEPGVTYRQLRSHLEDNGHRLWSDCTDGPPDGSVLGNALDKGVGETPYGDHLGTLCGLEVVLPDGRVVRTGGVPEGSDDLWHVHRWGTGPGIDGLFAQSGMGVVTRAGVWLMPEPEEYQAFLFGLDADVPLAELLETVRDLSLRGILDTKLHLMNDVCALSVLGALPRRQGARDALSADALAALRDRHVVPHWACTGGLYGPPEEVRARARVLSRTVGRLGRLRFLTDRRVKVIEGVVIPLFERLTSNALTAPLADFLLRKVMRRSLEILRVVPRVHSILRGVPSDFFVRHPYTRTLGERPEGVAHPARDGVGLIWFAPLTPLATARVEGLLDVCRTAFEEGGFDFYVAFLRANARAAVALMAILYRRDDPEDAEAALALEARLKRETEAAGYQRYRTPIGDRGILDCAPVLREVLGDLKRAVDPGEILAPGRYGVGEPRG